MLAKLSKKLYLFHILVAYIILQFIWWEVLLVQQTREIHAEQQKLAELASSNDAILKEQLQNLEQQEKHRIYMIVGEATVFLILISLGIIRVHRTYKRDTELALQQKNFLLSITHELKSPIASAKLQLQTIQKRELDKATQQKLIQNALNDTERLNTLVENVLMSAQLEAKGDFLHKEDTDVSLLINNTIQQVFHNVTDRVKCDIQPNVNMNLDKIAFPSIVINLIENAIKYSVQDSPVEVRLTKKENQIYLTIADKGCGISDNEKEKIFEKFYRSGNEDTRKTKGTGLGLFIVKQLVEQHKGKISVANNQPQGSIFQMVFEIG